ncbi:hypothetical protein GGR32_000167 [Mesonia hippocampi]|uniref:Uncharacterized protein n=1 Tax=Mesonia hippocampi TaxID=1628250 RepID=A0A840EL95_9FLAO|nr:hypothetical protein [Mesonia hippocampi]MBB4117895.1 hypothetical protein [Mesonia hippocampi]
MKKDELLNRFEKLTTVLELSSGWGYFSPLQRTCIHQERAAIFKALDAIAFKGLKNCTPKYTLPPHLEAIANKVILDFKQH